MKKTGTAVALRDYQYIHATGTGGIVVKISKGEEYDVINTGGRERVCVLRKDGKVILVPSSHKERYLIQYI